MNSGPASRQTAKADRAADPEKTAPKGSPEGQDQDASSFHVTGADAGGKPKAEEMPKKVETASNSKPVESKPQAMSSGQPANFEPYSSTKPSLMGLKINDTKETVIKYYGQPKDQYVMDDENDPVLVYEYTGFSVGFNKRDRLLFVDITSETVNPGLNGLRLGGNMKDALEALGKPDLNTDFVLTYKSAGAVLKLDIDPKTEVINSIKLFSDE